MRVVNVMLGTAVGGLERAVLDYTLALRAHGHDVLCITDPRAQMNAALAQHGCEVACLHQRGGWDWWAARKFSQLCRGYGAELVLTHGNRALSLAHKVWRCGPVVAVAHNYQFRHMHKADAVLCLTQHMQAALVQAYPQTEMVTYHIPNMLRAIVEDAPRIPANPVRIGAMGRFSPEKGFDVWVQALALLHQRGVAFEAHLAGGGEQHDALRVCIDKAGLSAMVHMHGWVEDVSAFYHKVDVMCVPSLRESFGLVVIEAMAHGLPVVVSDCDGPKEIIGERDIAMMVEKGSADAMATALHSVIDAPLMAADMGARARQVVVEAYAPQRVGQRLCAALEEVVAHWAL